MHLVPAYRPRVQTEKVDKKHVRVWSPECVSELHGCFDCTDWDVLLGAGESVNKTTHADPLQFTYKRDRGTDGATLTLLHHAFTHLDHKGSFVMILFNDFPLHLIQSNHIS